MHALVAKNLSHDFLKPTLYPKEILPYDYKNWVGNYIWVHKQPLFLWQMALSIKIFGVTPFAIRFPSVICYTFATYCVYRIGKNVANSQIGFWAAVFFSVNYFVGELISGAMSTDQNDVVFVSYVTASIWAFTEHILTPEKKRWWVLIGVFVGFAVLTKWLVGLIVYVGWGTYLLMNFKDSLRVTHWTKMIKSVGIAFIVFLPWQLYIFYKYPQEAYYEYTFNAKHFSVALEGHGGDNWYHYEILGKLYGYVFPLFGLLGLVLLNKHVGEKKMYYSLIVIVFVVYCFFTFAATKMESFTLIVCSIVYVGVGATCKTLFDYLNAEGRKLVKVFYLAVMFIIVTVSINIESFQANHTNWKKNIFFYYNRKTQIEWKEFCDGIKTKLPNDKYVIFNCPNMQSITLMFYTDYIGYMGFPTTEQIGQIHALGYKIAIYNDGNLPSNLGINNNYTVLDIPATKLIRQDTVYIKTEKNSYLRTDWENKLVSAGEEERQKFVIKTFLDGTSSITSQNNFLGSVVFEWGGKIYFNSLIYTHKQRFKIVKVDAIRSMIYTEDGTKISVSQNGEIIAENGDWRELDKFELFK